MNHAIDLALLIIVLVAGGISFFGWGVIVARSLGIKVKNSGLIFNLWLGIASSILYVEIVNIIYPINWQVALIFLMIGVVGTIKNKNIKFNNIKFEIKKVVLWLMMLAIYLIWASKSMVVPEHYDFDLYYQPTVNWLTEYSISFGIGNLNSRIGFNQSYFQLAALLNIAPVWNHGLIATNLLIMTISILTVAEIVNKNFTYIKNIYATVIALVMADLFYTPINPSPDATVGMIQVIIFTLLLVLFFETPSEEEEKSNINLLIVLAAIGVTVKLSSAIFIFGCLFIVINKIVAFIKNNDLPAIKIITFCTIFVTVHFLRGYILTGYPLYPSTFAGAEGMEWAIPVDAVRQELMWIYSWARNPGQPVDVVLGNWNWLPIWFKNLPFKLKILFGSILILNLICLFILVRSQSVKIRLKILLLYIPIISGIVFWFFSAPDYRFLGALAELLLILSILILYLLINQTKAWLKYRNIYLKCTFLSLFLICFAYYLDLRLVHKMMSLCLDKIYPTLTIQELNWKLEEIYWRLINISLIALFVIIYQWINKNKSTNLRSEGYLALGAVSIAIVMQFSLVMGFFINEQIGWRLKKKVDYSIFKTDSGLELNVPKGTDQCGDIPFPCTAYPNPHLHEVKNISNINLFNFSYKNLSVK